MTWVEKNQGEEQGERRPLDSSTTQNTSLTTQNHSTKHLNHSATSKTNLNLAKNGGKSRRVKKVSD